MACHFLLSIVLVTNAVVLHHRASAEEFAPRFGAGSRDAHVSEGAHELVEIDVPTLRRDVDTPDDLRRAEAHWHALQR